MENEYVINFFGSGIRFWICNILNSEYDQMCQIRYDEKKSWDELFFDFRFLEKLNRSHWSEFSSNNAEIGFWLQKENMI